MIRKLTTGHPAMKPPVSILAALLVAFCCGCATTAMKGTPFYTGEHDKREGPASDRVNLWPLAYYRAPALSILWPIGEFADDRFAIRPLFSMYRDGKDEPWSEFNSLGGLFSIDTERHSQLFFPLFYHDGEYDTFLSLLYAQGPGWTALPPLLSWWTHDSTSGDIWLFLFGGLAGFDPSTDWIFPLYYHEHDRFHEHHRFLSLLYAQGRDWTAIPPLLSWWNRDSASGDTSLYLLGGLAGFEPDADWVFPLYYRDKADDRFLSLLYAKGRDWAAIPPLLSWRSRDPETGDSSFFLLGGLAGSRPDADWIIPLYVRDKANDSFLSLPYAKGRDWAAIPPLLSWWDADDGGRALLGLGGWDDSRAWAFPLFYRDAKSDTLVTPLWASQAGHWSAIPPLLSWRSRDPDTGASSLFLLGGLVGFEPDADWVVPIYYRDKASGFFLSPLYAEGRDWAAIPPLLSWWDDDSGRIFLGLGGWDAHADRHWAFPFYYRDAKDGTFASILYAQGRDWTAIPPLLSWWDDDSGRVLLGLGGWEPYGSWAFPFWYEDSTRFLTPLWGRWRYGRHTATYWFTPLLGTRSGPTTGSWLFPLWDVERYPDGSWDNTFLLFGGSCGGPRKDGRTSVWFWPLFSYDSNPKVAALRAEMDAPRAPDREYYREGTAVRWDRETRTQVTNQVVIPVRDRAVEESQYLLGQSKSEILLNPFPGRLFRLFRDVPAKGPLARFVDLNAASEHQLPSSSSPSLPAGAAARYVAEDSSWFFLLWSHERMRGVMFDLPSGQKSLDAQLENFRALLFLYDWRHESIPEGNHDYTRRRVLWRLYHYERLNDAESTDIFPAITYDRRKDGYSKFSFLWRFFRYERDPGKGTSLDILFLPMRRPARQK